MPGGGPQGTILRLFLFLIQINDAGLQQEILELKENKLSITSTKEQKYL